MMNEKIILFDGVCNLCNGFVQLVIRYDKKQKFRFSSLQSDFSRQLFEKSRMKNDYLDSLVFYSKGKIHTRSGAALRIAKDLDGLWPVFYVLMIIPYPIRDFIYDIVARYRYKWFGKKDQCMVPTPELKSRFL